MSMFDEHKDYNECFIAADKKHASRNNPTCMLVFLTVLASIFCVVLVVNKHELRYLAGTDQIKRAQHETKSEYMIEYRFKQGMPGRYKDRGRENTEIDPQATTVNVCINDHNNIAMNKYSGSYEIKELAASGDGSRRLHLTVPGEANQIVLYFGRVPKKDEIRDSYAIDHYFWCTNMKVIYFADVRGKEGAVIDSPKYNYVRGVKTYDGRGAETGTFSAGDKVYVKLFDYSNNTPDGRDVTSYVAGRMSSLYSRRGNVVSESPVVKEDVLIFEAKAKGRTEFLYIDYYCIMGNVGRVSVR